MADRTNQKRNKIDQMIYQTTKKQTNEHVLLVFLI